MPVVQRLHLLPECLPKQPSVPCKIADSILQVGHWHLQALHRIITKVPLPASMHLHSQLTPWTLHVFPHSVDTGPATPLKRAPAWLKRPAGVAFGFGNRLVSFKNVGRQGQGGEHVDTGLVTVSHVRMAHHSDSGLLTV